MTKPLITDDGDCAICGSMMELTTCDHCQGEGGFHDCGDDCCVCADPDEITDECDECDGEGEYLECSALPHTDEQMQAWKAMGAKP